MTVAGPELLDVWASPGPDPDYAEPLAMFGRFVGSWDLEVIEYDEEGGAETTSGEWHWGWTLNGRAVQDVWISPSRAEQASRGVAAAEWGTAVRFYEPASDTWRVNWSGPLRGRQIAFIAHAENGRIVLDGEEAGRRVRWVFSELEDDRFRWAASVANRDGSWQLVQEMRVRRRMPPPGSSQ